MVLKSRRVLWVVSSLSAGGAERIIAELANGFAERGHEVALMTLSTALHDHYQLGEHVRRMSLGQTWASTSAWHRLLSNLQLCQSIRHAVLDYKPDIVISFIDQNNVRVLASLVGTGIPVIVSERTDPRRHIQSHLWTFARSFFYPMADRLVVQTEAVANWAVGIIRKTRVRIIENPVRLMPSPLPFKNREGHTILGVGRLDHPKGFDLLLHGFAMSGLAQQGVELTILGDGPERETLQTLARALGIEHAFNLPGVVADPEIWMARATVFVLPSRYEGFPNALLESMAMGCPSIATNCNSGPRDIIKHDVNGWLIPVDDRQALSEALLLMFGDPDLRARLGLAAVKVRERYSKARILQEWERVVEEVI